MFIRFITLTIMGLVISEICSSSDLRLWGLSILRILVSSTSENFSFVNSEDFYFVNSEHLGFVSSEVLEFVNSELLGFVNLLTIMILTLLALTFVTYDRGLETSFLTVTSLIFLLTFYPYKFIHLNLFLFVDSYIYIFC